MDEKTKLQRSITLFDLDSYIQRTFSRVKTSGDERRINCFAPKGCNGSDSKFHLWVNILKKQWICYKCGYGDPKQQEGTAWLPRFIADAEGVSVSEARRRLLETVELTPADELGDLLEAAFNKESIDPPSGVIKLPPSFAPLRKGGLSSLAYGLRRGMTNDQLLIRFNVRSCHDMRQKLWRNRLIFPVRDLDGWIKSAVGRDTTGKSSTTWRNWPRSDLQSLLWPLYWFEEVNGEIKPFSLRDTNPEHIVLVEGIFDWVGVEVAGYSALCTFGKKLSMQQVAVLQELGLREVTLAWDHDARDKMVKLVNRLEGRFDLVNVFPFISPVWRKRDFGDIPLHKELPDIFATEMASRISVDSDRFLEWAAKVSLEPEW